MKTRRSPAGGRKCAQNFPSPQELLTSINPAILPFKSVLELRKICISLSTPSDGNKETLIDRIQEHIKEAKLRPIAIEENSVVVEQPATKRCRIAPIPTFQSNDNSIEDIEEDQSFSNQLPDIESEPSTSQIMTSNKQPKKTFDNIIVSDIDNLINITDDCAKKISHESTAMHKFEIIRHRILITQIKNNEPENSQSDLQTPAPMKSDEDDMFEEVGAEIQIHKPKNEPTRSEKSKSLHQIMNESIKKSQHHKKTHDHAKSKEKLKEKIASGSSNKHSQQKTKLKYKESQHISSKEKISVKPSLQTPSLSLKSQQPTPKTKLKPLIQPQHQVASSTSILDELIPESGGVASQPSANAIFAAVSASGPTTSAYKISTMLNYEEPKTKQPSSHDSQPSTPRQLEDIDLSRQPSKSILKKNIDSSSTLRKSVSFVDSPGVNQSPTLTKKSPNAPSDVQPNIKNLLSGESNVEAKEDCTPIQNTEVISSEVPMEISNDETVEQSSNENAQTADVVEDENQVLISDEEDVAADDGSDHSEGEIRDGESDYSDITDDSDESDSEGAKNVMEVLNKANEALFQIVGNDNKTQQPQIDIEKAKNLLAELNNEATAEPIIAQAPPEEQECDLKPVQPPPPFLVPPHILKETQKRRERQEKIGKREDDDDLDDDEECYVDIDATYEMEIARLLIEALQRNEDENVAGAFGEVENDTEIEIIDWTVKSKSVEKDADNIDPAVCEVVKNMINDVSAEDEDIDAEDIAERNTQTEILTEDVDVKPNISLLKHSSTSMPPASQLTSADVDDENMSIIPPSLFDIRSSNQQQEDETIVMPHLHDNEVQLDFYNADLHMKSLAHNRHQAEPDTKEGLATMWCGMRATYGVTFGKVAFQCKVVHKLPSATTAINITDDMADRWGFRCGWSLGSVQHAYGYVLGDQEHTWAYSIAGGHKGTASRFVNWGRPAMPGDVITCLLDLHRRCMEFLVNGESCGVAFVDLPVAPLIKRNSDGESDDEMVLAPDAYVYYPHISAKNVRFECNFGQQDWSDALPAPYKFINDYSVEDRVRASKPPPTKAACTVLMMCGMPSSGKTRWVHEYLSEHGDEQWTVLSTDTSLEHMKLLGIGRHATDAMRWDHIMGLAWKANYRWMTLASRRKRNYIIDGTNVAAHARRRKMSVFENFNKKCVFIMPSEEIETKRRQRQEQLTGISMPDDAISEMKGLFSVPDKRNDAYFNMIYYAELPQRGSLESALIQTRRYNQQGRIWYQARLGYKYGASTDGKHYRDKAVLEQQQHLAQAMLDNQMSNEAEIIIADREMPQHRILSNETNANINFQAVRAGAIQDAPSDQTPMNQLDDVEIVGIWPRESVGFFGRVHKEEPIAPNEQQSTEEEEEEAEARQTTTETGETTEIQTESHIKQENEEAPAHVDLMIQPSASFDDDIIDDEAEDDDDEGPSTRTLWARTKKRRRSSNISIKQPT